MQTPPAPLGTGGIRRCSSQVRGARTIDHERCRHLLRCTPPDLPLGLLAAQSQMQAVLAAAFERALSLDWIGAIKDQGRVGQGLLAKSSIAVEHCGGRLAMIGDCQRGRPAAI